MSQSLPSQPVTFRQLMTDGSAEVITDDGLVVCIPRPALADFRYLRAGQRLIATSDDAGRVRDVRLPT